MSVVYDKGNGKAYRAPTDTDQMLFAKAQAVLDSKLTYDPDLLPTKIYHHMER